MTKEGERRFMQRLQQFEFFSQLKDLVPGESPDFTGSLNGKTIGIELTEAYNDDRGSGSPRKRMLSFKEQLGFLVVRKLCDIRPCFHLGIRFSDYLKLGKSEMDASAEKIASFLRPIIISNIDLPGFEISHDDHPFDEIDDIHCIFFESLTKSYYSGSDAIFVPHFEDENLQVILSRKERKLPKYRKCDEQWLVIREGNLTAGTFDQIRINSFSTSFDRVFIYRIAGPKLLELRIN